MLAKNPAHYNVGKKNLHTMKSAKEPAIYNFRLQLTLYGKTKKKTQIAHII